MISISFDSFANNGKRFVAQKHVNGSTTNLTNVPRHSAHERVIVCERYMHASLTWRKHPLNIEHGTDD